MTNVEVQFSGDKIALIFSDDEKVTAAVALDPAAAERVAYNLLSNARLALAVEILALKRRNGILFEHADHGGFLTRKLHQKYPDMAPKPAAKKKTPSKPVASSAAKSPPKPAPAAKPAAKKAKR